MENNTIIDQLKTIIKSKGMKYTEQRAVILQILVDLDDHLSAEDVHKIIKHHYPEHNIGIATIYRTLNFLEEVELISSISFGKDGKKYEGKNKKHHDHIICTHCGNITEFIDDNIEQRQEKVACEMGFKITDHTLQIYGICSKCQNQ
jgi:Fur family ferric uptake transcriptional regulator